MPCRHRVIRFLPAAVLLLLPGGTVAAIDGPAHPLDPTIRQALQRVQATYLEPSRIHPEEMRQAVLEATAAILGGTPNELGVETGKGLLSCPPVQGDDLAEALGPCLESLLDGGARQWPAAGEKGDLASDTDALRALMLNAALHTLDRFSGAYTAAARRNLLVRFTGTGVGIGVRLGRREGRLRVLEVYPDSGAAEVGMRAGDVFVAIDGVSVVGLLVSDLSRRLEGEEETPVEVEIDRQGERHSFRIVRRKYVRPSVSSRLAAPGVGLVVIDHLSKNTPDQVAERLQELFREHRIRRLIIDLRGNSGGSMLAAAGVADLFLREGILLEALDRDDRPVPGLRERVDATPRGWPRVPLIVLVDAHTGSSAELLAAALAWNDRGLLVGERTYGKNIVQKLHHFEADDLTLKISSAYMKAAGRRLPAEGLAPDVWIDPGGEGKGPAADDVVRASGDGEDGWLDVALAILAEHADASRTAMIDHLRDDDATGSRAEPGP